MKVLNLYAGLGGNRHLWGNIDVTAVEQNADIAEVYSQMHPSDLMVIGDAHQFLLDHYHEYDLIWSSPPCQSHSKMIKSGRNRKPRYPVMDLYQEIIFLTHNFSGKGQNWVVENVKPYYDYLIQPNSKIGRHVFWSNFEINDVNEIPQPKGFITTSNSAGVSKLKEWLGFEYESKNLYYEGNHDPCQVLRNCVHPKTGRDILLQCLINGD
tara:strand:- start:20 stop:649 length:630 start_codon:yes stop_codon:yes gene_type:complete